MRTTITLDPDVERLLRNDAHARKCSLKASLNQAVRDAFLSRKKHPAKRKKFVIKARAMGLRPGIDPLRLAQLAEEMEDAAILGRMREAEKAASKKR